MIYDDSDAVSVPFCASIVILESGAGSFAISSRATSVSTADER